MSDHLDGTGTNTDGEAKNSTEQSQSAEAAHKGAQPDGGHESNVGKNAGAQGENITGSGALNAGATAFSPQSKKKDGLGADHLAQDPAARLTPDTEKPQSGARVIGGEIPDDRTDRFRDSNGTRFDTVELFGSNDAAGDATRKSCFAGPLGSAEGRHLRGGFPDSVTTEKVGADRVGTAAQVDPIMRRAQSAATAHRFPISGSAGPLRGYAAPAAEAEGGVEDTHLQRHRSTGTVGGSGGGTDAGSPGLASETTVKGAAPAAAVESSSGSMFYKAMYNKWKGSKRDSAILRVITKLVADNDERAAQESAARLLEMEKRLQDLVFKTEQLAQSQAAELEKLRTETEAALAIVRARNQTTKAVNEKLITAQSQQFNCAFAAAKQEFDCALEATSSDMQEGIICAIHGVSQIAVSSTAQAIAGFSEMLGSVSVQVERQCSALEWCEGQLSAKHDAEMVVEEDLCAATALFPSLIALQDSLRLLVSAGACLPLRFVFVSEESAGQQFGQSGEGSFRRGDESTSEWLHDFLVRTLRWQCGSGSDHAAAQLGVEFASGRRLARRKTVAEDAWECILNWFQTSLWLGDSSFDLFQQASHIWPIFGLPEYSYFQGLQGKELVDWLVCGAFLRVAGVDTRDTGYNGGGGRYEAPMLQCLLHLESVPSRQAPERSAKRTAAFFFSPSYKVLPFNSSALPLPLLRRSGRTAVLELRGGGDSSADVARAQEAMELVGGTVVWNVGNGGFAWREGKPTESSAMVAAHLETIIADARPVFIMLQEVRGTLAQFAGPREWFRLWGYSAEYLPGRRVAFEKGATRGVPVGGVVLAWRDDACSVWKHFAQPEGSGSRQQVGLPCCFEDTRVQSYNRSKSEAT